MPSAPSGGIDTQTIDSREILGLAKCFGRTRGLLAHWKSHSVYQLAGLVAIYGVGASLFVFKDSLGSGLDPKQLRSIDLCVALGERQPNSEAPTPNPRIPPFSFAPSSTSG